MRDTSLSNPVPVRLLLPSHRDDEVALQTLERRLHDGYARIEQARDRGENVASWEEFWIDLLHQYEAAVDGMPEAA